MSMTPGSPARGCPPALHRWNTECPSPEGEEFGVERLSGIARVLWDAPASHIVSAIDALSEHSWRERLPDDASVFVVKRV